ncbi:response regulator [Geomesophilobacter sediminis]|uniref:Response regulator n=1 Tax=Geomesophilobacter sediminis TaxID=2798584 RepID=A0A8J7LVN6_9BACT|nr:response regulator [Geomesophilobacter sediminis]MBJ6725729.1 response regulator [Geomesophilobacter sediminis]
MTTELSAILIGNDPQVQHSIESALKSSGANVRLLAAVDDLQQGMRIMQTNSPNIVILDLKNVDQGEKETRYLATRFPRTAVFVTAAEKNPDWILTLIRAGAREYLTKPVAAAELAQAVEKVSLVWAAAAGTRETKGSVISVYNPSGGMGTTTVAVNLAALLAAQGKRTALLDLNLHAGDVAAFLDLTPRYTLASATPKLGALDADFLRSITVSHGCGVDVLNAPDELEEADLVAPELVHEVIRYFQTHYEYTIIDTGGPAAGCNLAVFQASDRILFNTVLHLPALRNAQRYLAALARAAGAEERIKLLVNRHDPREGIKVADGEKVLSVKVFQTIPNGAADVTASINKGVPLVIDNPRSPVARSLEELVRKLTGTAAPAETKTLRRFL